MTEIQERARQILEAEAAAIKAIRLDSAFDHAVQIIEACKGKVIVTGMGKAGIAGQRFAAVPCSTGTPAVFVHPGEAAHGDLGIVGSGDCLFAFSTSGKTREVIEMVELSRHLGPHKVVAMTSHPESDLRLASDIVIDMGPVTEPCSLWLTPTASIAVMSAIADALALAVMDRRGFREETTASAIMAVISERRRGWTTYKQNLEASQAPHPSLRPLPHPLADLH